MKKISEHLGQIIAALAAIALLIGTVAVFATPMGNFFKGIITKQSDVGQEVLSGIQSLDFMFGASQKKEAPAVGTTYETDDYIYTFGKGPQETGRYWTHGKDACLYEVTYDTDEEGNTVENVVGYGWHVKVKDTSKSSYGPILDEIDGYPVVCMYRCFAGCENLVTSPAIPASIKCLQYCFANIYDEGTDTSAWCNSLTGEIMLPDIVDYTEVSSANYDPWNSPSTGTWDGSNVGDEGPLAGMFAGKISGEPIIVKYTTKCGAAALDYRLNNAYGYDHTLIVKQCIDGDEAVPLYKFTKKWTGRVVEYDGVMYVYVAETDYPSAGFLAMDDGSGSLPNSLPSEIYGCPVIGTYEEIDNLPAQSAYSGVVEYTFNPYLGLYRITSVGRLSEAPADALETTVNGYPATGLKEYFAGKTEQNRILTYGDITYSWNADTESFTVPADQYENAAKTVYGYSVYSA